MSSHRNDISRSWSYALCPRFLRCLRCVSNWTLLANRKKIEGRICLRFYLSINFRNLKYRDAAFETWKFRETRDFVLSLWLSFAFFSYIKIIANDEIIIIDSRLLFLRDIIRLFRKFRILKTLLITIAYIEKNQFNVVHESKESSRKEGN